VAADDGDRDALTPGEVARRLGVAVTTLRSWHRRYGLGPTGHRLGRHRRYTGEDLTRLARMLELTAAGVPPAQAAHRALHPGTRPPVAGPGVAPLPVGDAGPAARGLARTALRMDAAALRRELDAQLASRGVVGAWEAVIAPVLIGVGTRHQATGGLVEVEHLLSGTVAAALTAVPAAPQAGAEPVLLACTDEEQHNLPLLALAAALGAAGVPVHMLGARVPPTALFAAVRRTGPAAVGLWSHAAGTADVATLAGLAGLPRPPRWVAALGPGWTDNLPLWVNRPTTLSDAVASLTAALR
jgi:DNA-binding transcriptional MerR regulator